MRRPLKGKDRVHAISISYVCVAFAMVPVASRCTREGKAFICCTGREKNIAFDRTSPTSRVCHCTGSYRINPLVIGRRSRGDQDSLPDEDGFGGESLAHSHPGDLAQQEQSPPIAPSLTTGINQRGWCLKTRGFSC